ncbi:MAG: hypothetical protein RLZZ387_3303 [Chloroflexota bacterium]
METFFRYINTLPMPVWLAMMLAPRHPLTERASRSSVVLAVICAHYVGALAAAVLRGRRDGAQVNLMTLDGVRAGMSTPEGAAAAWTHALALDLFAGAWIYRECRRLEAPAAVRVPALLGTLMAGPVGLLGFLLWRAVTTRRLTIEE